jgi:hypothetical protein
VIRIAAGPPARTLREIHEQLRDDLARLRVLADVLRRGQRGMRRPAGPGRGPELGNRAGDLKSFCERYCQALLQHQELMAARLFLPGPLAGRLLRGHQELADRAGRIRRAASALSATGLAATEDLRQELTGLSHQLEDQLSYEEAQILPLLPED